MSETPPLAVYVHWPYCARICPYCDFNVVRERGQTEQADLARAIVRDLMGQAEMIGPRRLTSIYLGGGTPSLMNPEWAAEIVTTARALWPTDEPVEITLEANPTDAEAGRFRGFRDAGVGRLSLGVQSLADTALAFLGRNHSAAEAKGAIDAAVAIFPRVSLDLIYALPDQTPEAWEAELRRAAAMGVEHISPYQLTIEQGTAFDRAVRRGVWTPPLDDAAATLYEATQAVLEAEGFHAYEVSNHARGPAAQSVHNLAYWRGWDYVGAGPGAHGRLTVDGSRLATQAHARPAAYIAGVAEAETGFRTVESLTPSEAAIERLLLGLRSAEGVALSELDSVVDPRQVALFQTHGLLAQDTDRLVATMAGRAVLDRLTSDLLA